MWSTAAWLLDQASEFAEDIRTRLDAAVNDNNHVLHPLASALAGAGCVAGVLETSTLRGQRTILQDVSEDA